MTRQPTSVGRVTRKGLGPLHRKLFSVLQDQIVTGLLRPGEMLPSEDSLCARYAVSRITVRRSLADLADIGLIQKRSGLGSFVRADIPRAADTQDGEAFSGFRQAQRETRVHVVEVRKLVPPPEVAARLRLAAGQPAVNAIRVRTVDGIPVLVTSAWVNSSLGKRLTAAQLKKKALYEILLESGLELGQTALEISSSVADKEQASMLKVEVGMPLLRVRRLMSDTSGAPVLFLVMDMSSDISKVILEIPSSAINTLQGGKMIHDVRFRLHAAE